MTRAVGRRQLEAALQQWPEDGGIDARGGQVGAHIIMRADHVALIDEACRGNAALGQPVVVAAFHAVIAVGTSAGVVLVLLPRGITSDGQLSGWVSWASVWCFLILSGTWFTLLCQPSDLSGLCATIWL